MDTLEDFDAARPRLLAIAYRMLGSASEAEDAVQETYLRWAGADREAVRVPVAWLTKVLTNVCLSSLTSARARREEYFGEWLPEPVFEGDPMLGPQETAEQRESVSFAVLTLLEKLTPQERAVFVLKESFSHSHNEIAEILDISTANSQQVFSRAKRHLADAKRTAEIDRAAAEQIIEEFLRAAASGDTDALVGMLTEDAVTIGDGGGVIHAARKPVVGAARVAKLVKGLFNPSARQLEMVGGKPDMYFSTANGGPALVVAVGERLVGVLSLAFEDGRISAIYNAVNPAKLGAFEREWGAGEHGEPLFTYK
ncbi:RNA polymerase sigma-70 factor [Salininema proteolyticum]|uniref:RNA polymerase sigma-70 factor n=1 Tax=Salininema proteolyticum TaxID=1607685 RepID=A0ABV8U1G4_9ACTN